MLDVYDRMKVSIPVGEVRGMKIRKFEVKDPDDWLESDSARTDIVSSAGVRPYAAGRQSS